MQITSLDYSSNAFKRSTKESIELFVFKGLIREQVDKVRSGDLCAIIGLDDFEIGDTLSDLEY